MHCAFMRGENDFSMHLFLYSSQTVFNQSLHGTKFHSAIWYELNETIVPFSDDFIPTSPACSGRNDLFSSTSANSMKRTFIDKHTASPSFIRPDPASNSSHQNAPTHQSPEKVNFDDKYSRFWI